MRRILQIEATLIRWESATVVVLLLLMLGLAAYNVAYRNVLVPIQRYYATSGPTLVKRGEASPPAGPARAVDHPDPAGGFGGLEVGETGGLEGAEGFGGLAAEDAVTAAGAEGFGGLGAEDTGAVTAGEPDPEIDAARPDHALPREPLPTIDPPRIGGPPPEGSGAALIVAAVDAVKLEWIDILLRQLVILVSFLGAMLATHRRKHINIEALGKVLPLRVIKVVRVATTGLAVVVCVILAIAGWKLVALSLQFPKDLVPWAREWTFQLMFPTGFGLLALHFCARLAEAVAAVRKREAAP